MFYQNLEYILQFEEYRLKYYYFKLSTKNRRILIKVYQTQNL